jgi:hypothetical protein
MRRVLFGSLIAGACFVTTLSAAPKVAGTASIVLNVPATSVAAFSGTAATLWPTLGDAVTFGVSVPKAVERQDPRIQVMCYQGTTLVYGEAGPYTQAFLLGGASSDWLNTSQGPAHCVADLYYWSYQGGQKFNWLASTAFDAGGQTY